LEVDFKLDFRTVLGVGEDVAFAAVIGLVGPVVIIADIICLDFVDLGDSPNSLSLALETAPRSIE
jgi:hypothetical protein